MKTVLQVQHRSTDLPIQTFQYRPSSQYRPSNRSTDLPSSGKSLAFLCFFFQTTFRYPAFKQNAFVVFDFTILFVDFSLFGLTKFIYIRLYTNILLNCGCR